MAPKPIRFELGYSITRYAHARPYDPFERRLEQRINRELIDPVHRKLRVYTQDPTTPRIDVAVGEI